MDTAARILDAAEALFAERGFSGTAVRDIATDVGLTPASLYNHFQGKQALYEAVLERGVLPILKILRDASGRAREPDVAVQIIETVMDHLARNPLLPRLITHETLNGGEHLRRLARDWIRPVLSEGVAEFERDPAPGWTEEEFPLVMSAWMNLVFGYFAYAPLMSEVFDQDPLSDESLARQRRFLHRLVPRLLGAGESEPAEGAKG